MSEIDPNKLKVVELKAELNSRGLDVRGVKKSLVKRLRDALDKENGREAGSEEPADNSNAEAMDTSQEEPDATQSQEDSAKSELKVDLGDKVGEDVKGEEEKKKEKEESDEEEVIEVKPVVVSLTSPRNASGDAAAEPKIEPKSKAVTEKSSPTKSEQKATEDAPIKSEDAPIKSEDAPIMSEEPSKPSEPPVETIEDDDSKPTESLLKSADLDAEESKENGKEGEDVEMTDLKSEATDDPDIVILGEDKPRGEKRRRSRSKSPSSERRREHHHRPHERRRSRTRSPYKVVEEEDDTFDDTLVTLDTYHSDLNLKIDKTRCAAEPLTYQGFAFMWAGARATYGFKEGKVFYELKVVKHLDIGQLENEPNPHVVRIGWSTADATLQLGEDPLSYGYGGTGKASTNCDFKDYGQEFKEGDVIAAFLNASEDPVQLIFAKNGESLGEAFSVPKEALADKLLYPHVLTKNCSFEVNFGQKEEPYFPLPEGFEEYVLAAKVEPEKRERAVKGPATRAECEMIMMCGLPGSGKTTWVTNYVATSPDKFYNILGTNSIIDKMKVMGLPRKKNYTGRWDVLIDMSTKCLNTIMELGSRRRRNFILDQTNVYASAQRRKMRPFDGFKRRAVVLVPTDEEFKSRIAKRVNDEGKDVPESAVLEMKASFVLPEVGTIFSEVEFVELKEDEARPLVEQYVKEGKAACPPAAKRFRPNERRGPMSRFGPPVKDHRPSGYRPGGGGGRDDYRRFSAPMRTGGGGGGFNRPRGLMSRDSPQMGGRGAFNRGPPSSFRGRSPSGGGMGGGGGMSYSRPRFGSGGGGGSRGSSGGYQMRGSGGYGSGGGAGGWGRGGGGGGGLGRRDQRPMGSSGGKPYGASGGAGGNRSYRGGGNQGYSQQPWKTSGGYGGGSGGGGGYGGSVQSHGGGGYGGQSSASAPGNSWGGQQYYNQQWDQMSQQSQQYYNQYYNQQYGQPQSSQQYGSYGHSK